MESPTHRYRSRIDFADTDASGIMHFASIFRHIEAAEHDYLASNGLIVHDPEQGGWPRVHVDCDYQRPLRARDEIEVWIRLMKVGRTSVVWDFEVCKVATGEVAVVTKLAAGGGVRAARRGRRPE